MIDEQLSILLEKIIKKLDEQDVINKSNLRTLKGYKLSIIALSISTLTTAFMLRK